MKKFEYLILDSMDITFGNETKAQNEINKLGDNGWELVNFTQITGAGNFYSFIFKRIKCEINK